MHRSLEVGTVKKCPVQEMPSPFQWLWVTGDEHPRTPQLFGCFHLPEDFNTSWKIWNGGGIPRWHPMLQPKAEMVLGEPTKRTIMLFVDVYRIQWTFVEVLWNLGEAVSGIRTGGHGPEALETPRHVLGTSLLWIVLSAWFVAHYMHGLTCSAIAYLLYCSFGLKIRPLSCVNPGHFNIHIRYMHLDLAGHKSPSKATLSQ